MTELVFATNNLHKFNEISDIIAATLSRSQNPSLKILNLQDIGCFEDIPETMPTLEGNALQKANYVCSKYGYNCFADDTGLEVEALGGRPGVLSARYGGEEKDFEKNIQKLLHELKGSSNRKARFRCVIALVMDGKELLFEGIVNGQIIDKKRGTGGFGYDSVFVPDGYEKTFAEMEPELKNQISHRYHAMQKLVSYLFDMRK